MKTHFEKVRISLVEGLEREEAKEIKDKARIRQFRSQLWKVDGYLEHGLSLHLLENVL